MELSPAGQQQADRLASWLARTEFAAVYASPMRRVQLTYEPFRRHFPGEPVILPGLREERGIDQDERPSLSSIAIRIDAGP